MHLVINEISFLATQGNNMVFHTNGAKIICRMTVSGLNNLLPMDRFIQVHKSFIIAKDRMLAIESYQVTTIDNTQLPVGAAYREGLKKIFPAGK